MINTMSPSQGMWIGDRNNFPSLHNAQEGRDYNQATSRVKGNVFWISHCYVALLGITKYGHAQLCISW